MYAFKLQVGCLVVLLYILYIYLKETRNKDVPCSKSFDTLIGIAPWAVIFDGVTAWTVNHRDIVPDWLNLVFHFLFFMSMNMLVLCMYYYMISEVLGVKKKSALWVMQIPAILSIVGIVYHMPAMYYLEGKTTWYSYGIPVFVVYGSLLIHTLLIAIVIGIKRKQIERQKRIRIEFVVLVLVALMLVQTLNPESLISSIMPVIGVMGIYLSFEDPAIKKLNRFNTEMVTSFATLVENRDDSTGGHIKRTGEYVDIILKEMKKLGIYKKVLTDDYVKHIVMAAPMHDIGKIAIPDRILQKPGKLTPEEYEIMKDHSKIGGDIIQETFANLGDEDYLKIAYEVARFHHEKWNGKGYPDGLSRDEIPLHARIMAIADVFDALSAERCYRPALPLEECFGIIEEGAGTDFDPQLVALFLNAKDEVVRINEAQKKQNNEDAF